MGTTRILTLAGAVLTAAGIYTFPGDFSEAVSDIATEVGDEPIGAVLVIFGVSLMLWANLTRIRWWLGLGRTNGRWISDIENWLVENRGYVRRDKKIVKDGRWRRGFHLTLAEQMRDAGGAVISERTMSFSRPPGQAFFGIRMGLHAGPETAEALRKGPQDIREELKSRLSIAISQVGAEYKIEHDNEHVVRVEVSKAIPVDSTIGELQFLSFVHEVLRAREVVNHTIELAGREARRLTPKPATGTQADQR